MNHLPLVGPHLFKLETESTHLGIITRSVCDNERRHHQSVSILNCAEARNPFWGVLGTPETFSLTLPIAVSSFESPPISSTDGDG